VTTTPSRLIQGRTGALGIVMGLDTHAQVATKAHSIAVATL
jgi:hypothetical protein